MMHRLWPNDEAIAKLRQVGVVVGLALLAVFALSQMAYRVQFTPAASSTAQTLLYHHPVGVERSEHPQGGHVAVGGPKAEKTNSSNQALKLKSKAERKAARIAERKSAKKKKKIAKRQAVQAYSKASSSSSSLVVGSMGSSGNSNGDANSASNHSNHSLVDCTGRHFSAASCVTHNFFPLPQQAELGCDVYVSDGLCDVGQYVTDFGRPSPNLNCSEFDFDAGACLNRNTYHNNNNNNNMWWPDADELYAKAFLSFQPLNNATSQQQDHYRRGRQVVVSGFHSAASAASSSTESAPIITPTPTPTPNQYVPFLFIKDYKTASEAVYETLFHFVKGVCVDGKLTNLDGYCATKKLGHGSFQVSQPPCLLYTSPSPRDRG